MADNHTKLDVTKFKTEFSGTIILPGDETYDIARVTFMFEDGRPAIIAQAKSAKDIAAAIDFAKASNLELSVRSGGHHAAGLGTNINGIVLDLSLMNSIEILDEQAGLVRLGPGAHWGDVAATLAAHGLAISSGDTKSVGVGGLTLGGGIGWMLRKYGYAIDCLVAAEVVLADGSIVRASESEHDDLFWALRGGGGNFGVVSSFEFKAHPQGQVVASTLIYGVDDLTKTITGWRDCLRTAPEELTSFLTLMPGFGGGTPKVMIMSCYANDDLQRAHTIIEPLRHLGTMISDDTAVKDYAEVLEDSHPLAGFRVIVKSMFAKQLNDELIAGLSEMCCKPGSPIVQLRMTTGAAARVKPEATALAHRDNEIFMFAGFAFPLDAPKESEGQALKPWEQLSMHSTGAYGNFLSTTTDADVDQVYPAATYRRLAKIKRIYDPENIFHHNFNIKPAKD